MSNYYEEEKFLINLRHQKEEDANWNKLDRESATDRYWREMKKRQVGENKPDYDTWTGSYY